MATIAIFGANGYAGDAIRVEALRRGHTVRAFSRSGTPRATSPDAIVEPGDIHDASSRGTAIAGADVVIVAIPAREIDGRKLLDAIPELLSETRAAGARLGVVGGSGSLQVDGRGTLLMEGSDFPAIARPEATNHFEVLKALRASNDADWFYVSPAAAFGAHAPKPSLGRYLVGGDQLLRDSKGESALSDSDLALAILDEIESPAHRNARFSVAGAY